MPLELEGSRDGDLECVKVEDVEDHRDRRVCESSASEIRESDVGAGRAASQLCDFSPKSDARDEGAALGLEG